jgi:uncharacterized membrane protein HdeD (DUF308 family)
MSIFENQGNDAPAKWRSWMHIVMGIVYILFGILIYKFKSFMNIDLGTPISIGLAVLMFLYGIFRIWRGINDLKAASKNN